MQCSISPPGFSWWSETVAGSSLWLHPANSCRSLVFLLLHKSGSVFCLETGFRGRTACVFFFFLFLFHNLAELENENELTSPPPAARSCFCPSFSLFWACLSWVYCLSDRFSSMLSSFTLNNDTVCQRSEACPANQTLIDEASQTSSLSASMSDRMTYHPPPPPAPPTPRVTVLVAAVAAPLDLQPLAAA